MEQDTHIMGLFPVSTWTRLMEETGFKVETLRLPADDGGYGGFLFAGTMVGTGGG